MTYSIALNFEDGVTRFIECRPDETVADASYRQRINIPLDCRDGACGTCKCFCESGSYDGGDYIEDALTDEEADEGYVLTCQMEPETDLVLRIPASSEVCKTAGLQATAATVVDVDRVSDTDDRLRSSWRTASALDFLPGQYVNIQVPGTDQTPFLLVQLRRPGGDEVAFLIRNIPDGVMSTYLRERAKAGDRIEFNGPWAASTCARSSGRCCCWPAAPGWRRSCRCWARSREQRRLGAPDPPGLRRHQRRRSGGGRRAGGLRDAHPELHLHLRVAAAAATIRARATSPTTSSPST